MAADSVTGYSPPPTVSSSATSGTDTTISLSSSAEAPERPAKARVTPSGTIPAMPGRAAPSSLKHKSRETGSPQERIEGLADISESESAESTSSNVQELERKQEIERKRQEVFELQAMKLQSEIRVSELESAKRSSAGSSQRSRGSRKERHKRQSSSSPKGSDPAGQLAGESSQTVKAGSPERASSHTRPKAHVAGGLRTPSPKQRALPGAPRMYTYRLHPKG